MRWLWEKRVDLWLIIALFSVLPFERIPSYTFSGYTLKASYLVSVVLILVSFGMWLTGRLKLSFTNTDKALVFLWVAGLLSLTQSTNRSRSTVVLLLWLFVFIVFYLCWLGLKNALWRERAESALLWVTAAVCLFGIYQFIGDCVGLPLRLTGLRDLYAKGVFGYPRIQSVALEPLYFSNYLLFPLAVSTKRMLKAEKPLRNWYTGLVLLIGVNLILGVSRSAYMALAVAVLFVAFWVGWQYYRGNMQRLSRLRNWGQVVLVGIGSLIVSFALLTIFTSPVATNRFLGHSMVDDTKVGTSIPGRLQTYGKAITFFREHPIVGIGIGDFGPRTVTSAANLTQYGYGIVNNEYLEIAAELGLLGLIAFFSVVYFYGREIWHGFSKMAEEDKWQNVLVLAALLAMLVQYNFFSTLYIIYIWAYLAWIRAEACSM